MTVNSVTAYSFQHQLRSFGTGEITPGQLFIVFGIISSVLKPQKTKERISRYTCAMPLQRYSWSALNKHQVGAYVEYFVKMELTMFGFQVYGTEVDDRGVDFVAQFSDGPFLKIQVKAVRDSGYVFLEKSKFSLHEHSLLAFGLLIEGKPPNLFLIPSLEWQTPTALLRDRNYGGSLKSSPEWGMNISKKNMALLESYSFEKGAEAIINRYRKGP